MNEPKPSAEALTDRTDHEYVARILQIAQFADSEYGIPEMCRLIRNLEAERDAASAPANAPAATGDAVRLFRTALRALKKCQSALDSLMGDTDPLDDTPELLACQAATKAIEKIEAALSADKASGKEGV